MWLVYNKLLGYDFFWGEAGQSIVNNPKSLYDFKLVCVYI
jgi:hypothetical protein